MVMTMTKGDIAKNNFQNGCNCAQAVLLAFCEDYGMEKETALMVAASFGSGMGGLRETCGPSANSRSVSKRKTDRLSAASCLRRASRRV